MNTLLLRPTDVLFFRDGRPMNGSLVGHTAAWPLPDVTNHALHAALHRANLDDVHTHRRGRSGQYSENPDQRDRKFGSLLTAGPFPVYGEGRWFFPRPKDAQANGSVEVTLRPARLWSQAGNGDPWSGSSLPNPLKYAVANMHLPDKEAGGEPWLSAAALSAYLLGEAFQSKSDGHVPHYLRDTDIADTEQQIGIGIDPETGSAAESQFYSAHYLRLREGFRLGVFAKAMDKDFKEHDGDLLKALLNGHPPQIVVGGQQRTCTAELCEPTGKLPLPRGLGLSAKFHKLSNGNHAVKWVLLSPAIWPEIPAGTSKRGTKTHFHPGGWLPNWICAETGAVLLRTVDEKERSRRRLKNYAGEGYRSDENAEEIPARLVAAIVPKPVVVTGWALPSAADPERAAEGGAKSTHLAVPAGAVYYFEADSSDAATALANALNWHGASSGTEIKNRRSTLLGEKGYGLGVCGTWKPFGDVS